MEVLEITHALGDPTRVAVVERLATAPARTGDLAAALSISVPALSRHLRVLRSSGLVERSDVSGDGRGREYRLRPGALDPLDAWLRPHRWASELASVSDDDTTSALLGRVGAVLDAFCARDVEFFRRHLRDDVVMVFPDLATPVTKQGCIDSVADHAGWLRHDIAEPVSQRIGDRALLLTFRATIHHDDGTPARTEHVTAVFDEGDPWRLAHLQWTPAPATTPATSPTRRSPR